MGGDAADNWYIWRIKTGWNVYTHDPEVWKQLKDFAEKATEITRKKWFSHEL